MSAHALTFTSAAVCVLATCAAVIGCGRGTTAQRDIDQRPLNFKDSRSGAAVNEVLMLPEYDSTSGISTGAGHGPGVTTASLALAFPFVYDAGASFSPVQPRSNGIMLGRPGDFFAGRGVLIKGVIAIPQNCEPVWVWQLWDRPADAVIRVSCVNDGNAAATRGRLDKLLMSERIDGATLNERERAIFDVIDSDVVHIQFTAAERRLVHDFLSSR